MFISRSVNALLQYFFRDKASFLKGGWKGKGDFNECSQCAKKRKEIIWKILKGGRNNQPPPVVMFLSQTITG